MSLLDRPLGAGAEPHIVFVKRTPPPPNKSAGHSPTQNGPSWARLETVASLLNEELRLFDSEPIVRGDENSERRLLAMTHVLQAGAMLRERFARVPHSGDIEGISLHFALTSRQSEVLAHLLSGMSEKEISGRMRLSQHTIHQHIKVIYKVTMVRSRSELMARFVHEELASLDGVHAQSTKDARSRAHEVEKDVKVDFSTFTATVTSIFALFAC